MKSLFSPLYDNKFDEEMIQVYQGLIILGQATIKQLQQNFEELKDFSYSQMVHILNKLIKFQAIEKQIGAENKYTSINPTILLERLKSKKNNEYSVLEDKLKEDYDRATHEFGQCTIQTNHYHFSSIELGFQIIDDRFIKPCQKSITFIATPPTIFKRFKWALIDAYERNIKIQIHYSERDFDELDNYPEAIKKYIKKSGVDLFEREYRTYEAISVNDEYTRLGQMYIDDNILINFPYYVSRTNQIQYNIDYISGFYQGMNIIRAALDALYLNPIKQQISLVPAIEARFLELLKIKTPMQRNKICSELNISGKTLIHLINKLKIQNKITIVQENQKKGRPKEFICLNDLKHDN